MTILADLKTRILAGDIPKGSRLPSEAELSAEFKVSRITSRRALTELVKLGLISRIQGAGSFSKGIPEEEHSARGKKNRPVISLLLPFTSQLGRSIDLFNGAREMAESRNYMLNLVVTERDTVKERAYLKAQMDSFAEGVIIYPITDNKNLDLIYEIEISEFPIVFIDKKVEGTRSTTVLSDNFGGSMLAVGNLVEHGHKNIIFITDRPLGEASSIRDRYLGYAQAMKDSGARDFIRLLDYSARIMTEGPDIPDETQNEFRSHGKNSALGEVFRNVIRQIMNSNDPPTAIVAVNDYVAIRLMRAAIREGLGIPGDLSLIGFDNIELASQVEIPLTTIEQDFRLIGHLAAENLIDQIEGKAKRDARTVTLPTRLIARDSVAARKITP